MNRRQILKSIFVSPIAALLGTKLVDATPCLRCDAAFVGTPGTDQYLCDACVEHLRFVMEESARETALPPDVKSLYWIREQDFDPTVWKREPLDGNRWWGVGLLHNEVPKGHILVSRRKS